MHWVSKMVVFLVVASTAANAQCTISCSFENYGSPEAPPSHCHHKSAPDKGRPASLPCPHEVSLVDANAKVFTAISAHALAAEFIPLPISGTLRPAFYAGVSRDISPPAPDISSITVLRI